MNVGTTPAEVRGIKKLDDGRRMPRLVYGLVYKDLSALAGASPILRLSCKSKENKRADERTRTAYPCSLRVIGHVLQGGAEACKSRIFGPFSLLWFAPCCTVLRSRWYQIGIRSTSSPTFANSEKGISRLPLPPLLGRRRQPHLEASPGLCATPPPTPHPCPSARRRCERRPRRG